MLHHLLKNRSFNRGGRSLRRRLPLPMLCTTLLLAACTQFTPPETPELDASEVSLSTAGGSWTELFNERNLDGWYTYLQSRGRNRDPQGVIKVEDGMLHILDVPDKGQRQEFGYVATQKSYSNYHLRFQYRWGEKRFAPRADKKRDSGVVYHVKRDKVWPSGVELQVQEGDTGDFWLIGGTHMTTTVASTSENPKRYRKGGTPYTTRPGRFVPLANSHTQDKRDGWNTVELIVSGDTAVHIVNGEVVNRAERLRDARGKPLTGGRIVFQVEGAEVYYKNIEIKPVVEETGSGEEPDTNQGGKRISLFSGGGTDAWRPKNSDGERWSVEDGTLEVRPGSRITQNDFQTKQKFDDFRLHLEFQVPPSPPSAREQGRGNSGVYLQGRYEVQILDSYRRRLRGRDDAGAIYGVRDASRNVSRPVGSWQTYDVTFRAARFSGDRKVSPARLSLRWNGVLVHNNVIVRRSTRLGAPEGSSAGPIILQDHGRPVRFRDIWIEPL